MKSDLPTERVLSSALLKVLKEARGPLRVAEIEERLRLLIEISANDRTSSAESKTRSDLSYRLAWCRTRLRKNGEIVKVGHGVWSLSPIAIEENLK